MRKALTRYKPPTLTALFACVKIELIDTPKAKSPFCGAELYRQMGIIITIEDHRLGYQVESLCRFDYTKAVTNIGNNTMVIAIST
ncbi:MAG: hypothetical protein NZL95_05940 [Chitinophagales bacterium]|nr:hypothetical protein [Chitinophagales bacterium]MDW8428076.1 hypothetical protein [Chitinophagales bacterium]